MKQLAQLAGFVAIGLLAARFVGTGVAHQEWLTYTLLAIGLYASTFGIGVNGIRRDGRLILTATTVGVVFKALLIGGALALAWRDPLFLVLGIAVAQIDPLAVAALMGDERMSPRARTILVAWSSFDDPITVLLTLYVSASLSALGWIGNIAGNLLLAALTIVIWRHLRPLRYPMLVAAFVVAIAMHWMLAVAIIGLFCSPAWLERWVSRATAAALAVATILLGMVLSAGVAPAQGITLGLAAFGAQMVVGWLLTRGLPRTDRTHIALAQQNGITAIILALALLPQFDRAAAVIAPAILVVNLTHLVVNRVYDRRTGVRDLGHA